jgi:cyclopropane fatty-acyl-phospholipid synthase-like methyltransferase
MKEEYLNTSKKVSNDVPRKKKSDVLMANEIRSLMLERTKEESSRGWFNLKSNLNWFRYEMQVNYLSDIIPPHSKVLEVGCGLGHTTAMLAKARPDIEIIGTDIRRFSTWDVLDEFGCSFRDCNAIDLPFDREEFNAIISFGVMEHTNDDLLFLKEVHRCLKEDGYNVIFQIPNKYSLNDFFSKLLRIDYHEKNIV